MKDTRALLRRQEDARRSLVYDRRAAAFLRAQDVRLRRYRRYMRDYDARRAAYKEAERLRKLAALEVAAAKDPKP